VRRNSEHVLSDDEKLKYLSYVLHAMNFEEKRNIIAERMVEYFPNRDQLLC
jgi:hypothetical protein